MNKPSLILTFAAVVGSCGLMADERPVALDKIDRSIAEEPEYRSSSPLYGLYVLDVAHQTRVWAVLDKSKPDGAVYDVLFFDLNGNGKLTDEGERFHNSAGRFELGEFTDPRTGDTHTGLKLSRSSKGSVMLGLNWKGKHRVGGGYAGKPGPYTNFGKTPAAAPVVKMVGEGTFTVQTWMAPETLKIGDAGRGNDIKFFVGHAGVGPNTFSSVMHPFLPEDVALLATLVYGNTEGKPAEVTSRLTSRC